MRCSVLVGSIAACVTSAASATTQSIRVGEHIRVSTGLESRPLVEPHLAVHPSDPSHLLAATIVSDAAGAWRDSQTCATFLSHDRGQTWRRHDFPVMECGDPWVAITPSGHAVFIALGIHRALPSQARGGLVVFHSDDGGTTWDETPVALGPGHDHPTLAVDTRSAARSSWVYVVSGKGARVDGKLRFSVFVTRSMDGGKTFGEATTVVPSNLNLNAQVPAVLSDGSLVVPFTDFQRNVDEFTGAGMLDRRRVWILKSTNAATSFSVPLFATEACAAGWMALAADSHSEPFRDRIYVACRDKVSGSIVLTSSSDGGEVWSEPIRVQPPAEAAKLEQPTLAVTRSGVLGIAWIESSDQASSRCAQVQFAASVDGGRTFLPPQPVSGRAACADRASNGAAFNRWPTGGDYFGMVAAGDGRFHLLWSDARDKVFQLWSAPVTVDRTAAEKR